MSESPYQKKYDTLLNLFLKNNDSIEKDEREHMQQWLEDAANKLRSQFQQYRGETTNKLFILK